MALVKHNNNSISNITSFAQIPAGKPVLLSTATASSSASIEFTSGIDSTYDIYKWEFINIHPATDGSHFQFQTSTNSGSSYGVTATTTFFNAFHNESDASTGLSYQTSYDLAQSTSFQSLNIQSGSDNDQSLSGELQLFNPSSSTFVKHFIATTNNYQYVDFSQNNFSAGYFNTTTALNAIKFQMSSGNLDSGTIKMYGISA